MSNPTFPRTASGSALQSIREHYSELHAAALTKLFKAQEKISDLKEEVEQYEAALASLDGNLLPLVQRFGHMEQHELFEADSSSPRLTRVS